MVKYTKIGNIRTIGKTKKGARFPCLILHLNQGPPVDGGDGSANGLQLLIPPIFPTLPDKIVVNALIKYYLLFSPICNH